MRQIVVDYARSYKSQKRGGGALKVEPKEIVDLHEALETLATLDSRKAQVVELKYFGGSTTTRSAQDLAGNGEA